ncbi:MAG: tRNA lysidine(34) synthetase TilS, partial [Bacteroidia bacterium]
YEYFEELKNKGQFDKLITAHHRSDALETFFINLYRTSGIQGLKSIPVQRDYIIRPFLVFSSVEIETYLESHDIPFRSDSSNQDTKYLRNKVRQEVLPNINLSLPDFEERAIKSISYLNKENDLLEYLLQGEIKKITTVQNGRLEIQKKALFRYPQPNVVLYRILDKYGFNPSQCLHIIDTCQDKSGSTFSTVSAELIVDREHLYVQESKEELPLSVYIPGPGVYSFGKTTFNIEKITEAVFSEDSNEEFVSLAADLFPLKIRNWEQGDRFQPLGMKGSKLLSDFFIDQKIDIQTKRNTPLLCSENEIVWVMGHRISEKIKVTNNRNLYRISYQEDFDY